MNLRLPLVLITLAVAGCGGDRLPPQTAPPSSPPSVRASAVHEVQLVRLSEQQAAELAVQTVRAGRAEAAFVLEIPGTVEPAPEAMALVSAPISGRVVRVLAHEGEVVRAGQPLLELESLDFAGLVADLVQAEAEATYQRQQAERLETLVAREIVPRARLEKAQADLQRAEADVQAAHARLHTLGISNAEIARWSSREMERPLLTVRAPLAGFVNEHLIDLGQAVQIHDRLLSIVDLRRVLVRGYASPEDAALIRPGAAVEVTAKEAPGRVLRAEVTTLNPALDAASRSVTVNVLATTDGAWPLPGQAVRLAVRASSPEPVLTLPLAALQVEGETATVFVRRDPLTFEKRPVELARVTEAEAVVVAGLAEGEEVAVTQVFSLKALSRYEEFAE